AQRAVWIDGELITDPTTHPLTRGGATSLAAMFDRQHKYADECLMADPETAESISISHMLPRSRDDLRRRQAGLTRLSEGTAGLMGRTPDYMNMKFSAFGSAPWVWAGDDGRNERGAENIVAYRKHLARADIALTHTIIQPTVDKRTDSRFLENHVNLHKVGETSEGIVVRGGRVLATLAPFADETAVYPALPLPPGAEAHALAFAIPLSTPGLKFLCRDSAAAPNADPFDKPLSVRFDEQDAFCMFDDVVVPWDRVFVDGDIDIYNSMNSTCFFIHMVSQSTTRALTKLEFAYGLACRMAEMIGDESPATIELLGELACYVEVTNSAVELSIEHGWERERDGMWFPAHEPLAPMKALLATWMPRVNEIITLIGSHNLLTTPTRSQLDDAALRPLIDEMLHGADDTPADERAAVFRMAWDFVGSTLAGRGFLYERFYLTSATRNRQILQRGFDRTRANAIVDDMLSLAETSRGGHRG
ncbi:MAG TPA: 4-hydroxyphenylacetate 3-hydroxylase N-terminal domain-containing protein, partial [Acidimicrobiales bacterium]|nr:4-hydroxyphenylacetate 3-hydroxylase N-terminal domain-containing protein [Acidimicrobiales bacterium]